MTRRPLLLKPVLLLALTAGNITAMSESLYALGGHDDTPEQDYIDYAANNPELQSTGWMFLFADDGDTTPDSFASSVFLDDGGAAGTHWVLTAGHALDEGILGPVYDSQSELSAEVFPERGHRCEFSET